MKTPSTVNTTLKSRGSAISKSKRPDSRSRNKNIALISNRGFQNTVTK